MMEFTSKGSKSESTGLIPPTYPSNHAVDGSDGAKGKGVERR
jgi:hypothetical protein